MRRAVLIALVGMLVAAAPGATQTPQAQVAATPRQDPASPALQPRGYTYDPDGRRDPFISLVRRTTEATGTSATLRPAGLAGMSTGDIALRGIVRGAGGWVAVAKGTDNKTYYIRVGDRLYDGVVRAIEFDALYVVQEVAEPLSPVKRREIRKPLRPTREAQ